MALKIRLIMGMIENSESKALKEPPHLTSSVCDLLRAGGDQKGGRTGL